MTEVYDELNKTLQTFISRQKIFFIATATERGKISLSPKSSNTFRCLDNKTVAYLDLTGSGNETAMNLSEDSRMTIMFCSFDTEPMTLRLYGRGEVITQNNEKWDRYCHHFPDIQGKRQIILLNIDSAMTSCGSSVPLYVYKKERTT